MLLLSSVIHVHNRNDNTKYINYPSMGILPHNSVHSDITFQIFVLQIITNYLSIVTSFTNSLQNWPPEHCN